MHATIDFETYSEAGYTFNSSTRKWEGLLNANVKGLGCVGTASYAKHPSTRILSLAYKLPNAPDVLIWTPDMICYAPFELLQYINDGGAIEAWNVSFERWIWEEVAVKRYGFPPVLPSQWRCAAAKSRAHALPGKLSDAAKVLGTSAQKDKDGTRLLNKFSMPRNPTLKDDRLRITVGEDPEDAKLLYQYNLQDVKAEIEISERVPDLSPFELEFWQCDQEINHRGVQIDVISVMNCINIIEQAHAKYNAELPLLTDDAVTASSQIARIRAWMAYLAVETESLDEEHITSLLANPLLLPQIRRVLEIRQLIGSAAVKKLYAMLNQVTPEGRIHDLFIYHSARTGRAAGMGVQPQNLPRGEEGFNVELALDSISTGSLDVVEAQHGNAVQAVSNCLRGMFIAKPGHVLIASDYSAIEGVVLAELAGEDWRREVFRTHGMVYETSASKITGVPLDEMIKYKNLNGKHHPDRKIGKVAELACLDSSTIVLTKRGYRPIIGVSINDELWDGEQWVKHHGVIYKGIKKTILLDGVKVTPNHPIYLGNDTPWENAEAVLLNGRLLDQALVKGSEKLPSWEKKEKSITRIKYWLNATVPKKNILLIPLNYFAEIIKNVGIALLNLVITIPHIKILFPTLNYVPFYSFVYITQFNAVTILKKENTQITEDEELPYVMNGVKKAPAENGLFYNTLLALKIGTLQIWKWTGSTIIGAMNLEISDSSRAKGITTIDECLEISKKELMSLNPVYDIVNAGPNHRFTIKTDSGHLIVHNSGYGGWLGAWHNFGANEFMSDDEIKRAILAWRDASPSIVEFWGGQQRWGTTNYYGVEGAAIQAVLYPWKPFEYRGLRFVVINDVLHIALPSGRRLFYHGPRLEPSTRRPDALELSYEGWNTNPKNGPIGWIRQNTYGGKLVENITSGVARDILANAIVNLERAGFPVVLHVHDEIVAEIPQGLRSLEHFEAVMSTMPAWAEGWPVVAKGGWLGKRYCK